MQNPDLNSVPVVARRALKELARRQLAPTPENYTHLFYEIAGTPAPTRVIKLAASGVQTAAPVTAIKLEPTFTTPVDEMTEMLQELLARAIAFTPITSKVTESEVSSQAEHLATRAREITSVKELKELRVSLRDFWIGIERNNNIYHEFVSELGDLVKMMGHGLSELVVKDSWLEKELKLVQNIVNDPIDVAALKRVKTRLMEILVKQGTRKTAIQQAENAVREMVTRFIDRLAGIKSSTGEYQEKLSSYAELIERTDNIEQLNRVLNDLMFDTRVMQTDALRSHEELTELRGQVSVYEDKIQKLESELVSTAELIKEDPLTHVLNRRGLHDVFHVEMTRCERRNVPLSVAMIDIDDFKRLNDTYGHQAGDAALAHLAKLMRDMLRATDWIARYGGEEFVILMPETDMQQGIVGISRVKSALAGLPVPYKDQQISMTFSAGVTQGVLPEKDTDMLERADRGLYRAKAEGKDRVIGEP